MRIWLDDVRPMPEGFDAWLKCAEDILSILNRSRSIITHIDFDHDLGEGRMTGYDLAVQIEQMAQLHMLNPISWQVHSQNPVGSRLITMAMRSAERFWYK